MNPRISWPNRHIAKYSSPYKRYLHGSLKQQVPLLHLKIQLHFLKVIINLKNHIS